ncbi:MAG: hypothetical protein ACR2O2_01920, partial [Ruegeria sp.]
MKSWVQNKLDPVRAGLKSDDPMEVGKTISKVFLVVVVALAILPQYTEQEGWQFRIVGFLFSPSNEIGDTLAGVAGVLAFLWIIITIWLQSQELAAHRKELKLARQAQEKQLETMEKQANIFLQEQQERSERNYGELFREQLQLFCSNMNRAHGKAVIFAKPGNYYADVSQKLLRPRLNEKVGLV